MAELVHSLKLVAGSPSWPQALETIELSPDALWLRGRVELLARTPRIAIVGSRAPTPYGMAQARRFASELADAGATIVSGMARGIDEAAHCGALDVGGATIAVLGSGVDRPWPSGELATRLASDGLLVSEFAPGEPPRRHHFPLRNRVISGLCVGVVVIEAAYASGSLITARWAIDQNRAVFAVPGRVDHPMAAGCHRLIRDGAVLVEKPSDVAVELGLTADASRASAPRTEFEGDEVSRELLVSLEGETLDTDELTTRLGRTLDQVLPRIVELELAGLVARGPGGLYRLNR